MAIGAGDLIDMFGTATKVTTATPGSVAAGSFSVAGDVNDWTNTDDAPMAQFVLVLLDLSGAATAGDYVELFAKPLNIVNTTDDHQGPNANAPTIYLDSFRVDAVDPAATGDAYSLPAPVRLPNCKTQQEYEFYIRSQLTTVSIDVNDWELWVIPMTGGPHV